MLAIYILHSYCDLLRFNPMGRLVRFILHNANIYLDGRGMHAAEGKICDGL